MRSLTLLPPLLLAACGPGDLCGFGERGGAFGCAAADTLVINVDERTDGVCRDTEDGPDCSFRRGIGVNVCPVRAFDTPPDEEIGGCRLFTYDGPSPDETFAGDAGLVIIGTVDGAVALQPEDGQDCYASDLFPTRDDLFQPDDEMSVAGFGGADFPEFDLVLEGPAPLIVNRPTEVVRGEDLVVEWEPGEAERVVVIAVTYDADADRGARINCLSDDDGELTMDAALTAALLETDETAQLFVLRQNAHHLEPAGAEVVIEGAATVSDVVEVPLR